jgi:hypothetical protein
MPYSGAGSFLVHRGGKSIRGSPRFVIREPTEEQMGVVKVYLLISFIFTGGISAAVISAAVYAKDWMSQQLGPFAVFHIESYGECLNRLEEEGGQDFQECSALSDKYK